MRTLLPVAAGRGTVACAATPVPRRSLLLSTAAAGEHHSSLDCGSSSSTAAIADDLLCVFFFNSLQAGAALQPEQVAGTRPLRLTRSEASAVAKPRTLADEAISWAKKDNRRLLHVVYRVGDLDKTIKYSPLNSELEQLVGPALLV